MTVTSRNMGAGRWSPAGIRATHEGSLVRVKVKPRSRHEAVDFHEGGIVVRVQAPPAGGRANEAARRLLASALRVSPSQVQLLRGAASREKEFKVWQLQPEEIVRRLQSSKDGVRTAALQGE